jgi:uncharacterized protein (UPF0332 family)
MEVKKLILLREKEGKLRKQVAGLTQVEALLRQAVMDLEESKKIVNIAGRAAYIMAYMAMLKAGRALLLEQGYVPVDGAQHRTVVEITGAILAPSYTDITAHFEVMRRKRNEATYEAGALISFRDSQAAFSDAAELIRGIINRVKEHNPQHYFEFLAP